jgi:mannose-6-phosphate isomerase
LIRKISNSARDYAWGSPTLISDYFGIEPTGKPMAEIWFGTHPGSPTAVTDGGTLQELRAGAELPFLLKILAAGQPLSIQAHPNKEQALAGFERENAAGTPIDSPVRDYKDDHHKPELIVALTEFQALVGFRPRVDIVVAFQRLAAQAQSLEFDALEEALTRAIQQLREGGIEAVFADLLARRGELSEVTAQLSELAKLSRSVQNIESENLSLVPLLEELYPGDPGILVSQLMNLVVLQPMDAVELEAGEIHAYVSGLGIEVMASSDNVLRGGLTPKHINVEELLRVVSFKQGAEPILEAKQLTAGLWQYPSRADDYLLYRIEVGGSNLLADLELPEAAIVICTSGEVAIGDSKEERQVLRKGEAAYLSDARFFSFSGAGTLFLATS